MKKGQRVASKITRCLILTLACLSVVTTQNAVSPHEKTGANPDDVEVLVTIKFASPNGNYIHATQHKGGLIRIEKGRFIYLLTPRVDPAGVIFIETNTLDNHLLIGPALSYDSTFRANVNKPPFELNKPVLLFPIWIEKIQRVHKTNGGVVEELNSQWDKPKPCCLTCDGITTCACAVSAPCGSCCIDVCCE